jgi:hypothetical protein
MSSARFQRRAFFICGHVAGIARPLAAAGFRHYFRPRRNLAMLDITRDPSGDGIPLQAAESAPANDAGLLDAYSNAVIDVTAS